MATHIPPSMQNHIDELDYLSAAIFWLYIVAALLFTSICIHTIYQLRLKLTPKNNGLSVSLFSALATLSFTVLSVNMLNVLIQSFSTWTADRNISPSSSDILPHIWHWSLTSTLFRDFAQAIVATPSRFLWTEAELFATGLVCLYMGQEGRRHQLPNLSAFFALAQILPISFAQNLFYLALLSLPQPPKPAPEVRMDGALLAATLYCTTIARAAESSAAWLMPLVAVSRVLLASPLVLTRTRSETVGDVPGVAMNGFLACYMAALWSYAAVDRDVRSVGQVVGAMGEHAAVRALGCDFVVSGCSFVVWLVVGRVARKGDTLDVK